MDSKPFGEAAEQNMEKRESGCIDAAELRARICKLSRAETSPELFVYECIDSTNRAALEYGKTGGQRAFFVAARQEAGRGRIGRSFYSPEGGLYMSLLTGVPGDAFLRTTPDWAGFLTCAAGVALTDAVQSVLGIRPQLKWVNDLIYKGRKAGGILTEGLFSGSRPVCAVIGVGVNLWLPESGFPREISENISTLLDAPAPMAREALAAEFYVRVTELLDMLDSDPAAGKKAIYEAYRSRLCMLGSTVEIRRGRDKYLRETGGTLAVAEDLTEDLGLLVRFPDGSTEVLSSAEVSVAAK